MFENIRELLPHKDEENMITDMPYKLFIVFSFEIMENENNANGQDIQFHEPYLTAARMLMRYSI